MTPEQLRTAVLVVNVGARTGEKALAEAAAALRAAGYDEVEVHATRGADLMAALDDAVAEKPDLLVVGGGDGTVSAAAGRVAGSGTVLGVLPLGTANDFARTLGIPSDLTAAAATLTGGMVVDVDLGRADGRAFLNVASAGLSVAVTEKLSPRLKKWIGPLAYPIATLSAYRSFESFTARLEFPDGDHAPLQLDDVLQVAVGNGVHHGGGATVSPTASIDDHLLDVYAVERGRLRDHVSIARLLKDGTFVEHERVHHLTTRRLRLVTEPSLPVNLDGEIGDETPTEFTIERNAVHVLVPLGSTAATLDQTSRSTA